MSLIPESLNITMDCEFVPLSKSRMAKEKSPSLNWKVTLKRNGREFLTTDYTQGCGHTPAYKNLRGKMGGVAHDKCVREECETGRIVKDFANIGRNMPTGKPIDPPSIDDVVYSLLADARVIDAGGFSEWCAELGMNDDSISAKATFDACMEIALKLRSALGAGVVEQLNELFADY